MAQERKPVAILAEFEFEVQNLNEILPLILEMQAQSLQEEGCIRYEIYQPVEYSNVIILSEIYKDEVALGVHKASNHYQQLIIEKIKPLLTGRSVKQLTEISNASSI